MKHKIRKELQSLIDFAKTQDTPINPPQFIKLIQSIMDIMDIINEMDTKWKDHFNTRNSSVNYDR